MTYLIIGICAVTWLLYLKVLFDRIQTRRTIQRRIRQSLEKRFA